MFTSLSKCMPENVVIINDDWLNDQLTDQQIAPKPSAGARMREAVATQNSSLWLKSFVVYEMRLYALRQTRYSCSDQNMIRSYQYICLVWQKPELFVVALTLKCIAGFSINQIYWHNFDFKLTAIVLVYEKLINFTSDIVSVPSISRNSGNSRNSGILLNFTNNKQKLYKKFWTKSNENCVHINQFKLWFMREFLSVWKKCT